MAGKPVARLGDAGSHGGKIITGASTAFINSKPLARVGDLYDCGDSDHAPNPITRGADKVKGNGMPFAHVGSKTACGATIIEGSPNVFVGENVFFGVNVAFVSEQYDEQVAVIDEETNEPIVFYPYFIAMIDGQTYSGRTDDTGCIPRIRSLQAEEFEVFWGKTLLKKARHNYFIHKCKEVLACQTHKAERERTISLNRRRLNLKEL